MRELKEEANVRITVDDLHAVRALGDAGDRDSPLRHAVLPGANAATDKIAKHDESETTALEWLSPREAIARFDRRELLLPPPTYTSIRQLAPRTSIDDVLAWAKSKPIVRVMPGFFKNGDVATLTLPGDPMFPTIPDWDVPEETRFVLQDGARWQPSKA